jgi:hypothetical protein
MGAAGGSVTGGPSVCALANYSYINSLSRGVPSILVVSQNDKCWSAAQARAAILGTGCLTVELSRGLPSIGHAERTRRAACPASGSAGRTGGSCKPREVPPYSS